MTVIAGLDPAPWAAHSLRDGCPRSASAAAVQQLVGWVERSETHRLAAAKVMGFAFALPILRARTALAIGKQATCPSSNIPRISVVYSDRRWVRGEVVVMSDKILDRPAMLLT